KVAVPSSNTGDAKQSPNIPIPQDSLPASVPAASEIEAAPLESIAQVLVLPVSDAPHSTPVVKPIVLPGSEAVLAGSISRNHPGETAVQEPQLSAAATAASSAPAKSPEGPNVSTPAAAGTRSQPEVAARPSSTETPAPKSAAPSAQAGVIETKPG